MKSATCYFFLLMLLSSCVIKKLEIPSAAINLETKEKISARGIKLEKGKICYIYTTNYEGTVPGQNLFVSKSKANFIPRTLGTSTFMGGGSSVSEVDTVINSDLLVQTALQEVIDSHIPGFQFQFVPQEEFTDSAGNLRAALVQAKFKPDIIINLQDLTLKVAGDANISTNVVASKPMMEIPGEYSSISPNSSHHGNILMDYTATWEIVNIKENQKKRILLTGRYISRYYAKYSMYNELMTSAKKAGKEFAALIKAN